MNDLTQIPSSTAIKQTLNGLSPGLKSLLAFEPSNLRAVSEIAASPALLAEVTAALPAIKANATAPATHEDIKRIIGAKFATYRQPQRSDSEWTAFWADYFVVLDGTPVSALEAAMDACLGDASIEFLPKPAKIRDMARMTPNRAVKAYDRAKAAVEYEPPIQREKLPPEIVREMIQPIAGRTRLEPTQADKDRVKRMMREFIEADDARKAAVQAKASEIPPCHAEVDETGLSAELRARAGAMAEG